MYNVQEFCRNVFNTEDLDEAKDLLDFCKKVSE